MKARRLQYPTSLLILSVGLLSGCAAQPESVIACLNNPTGCLVNADTKVVKQLQVPVGTATISENPITGTGMISEYNGSGQYETDSLGKITNLRVSRPYQLPGQTDVAISGSTPGCSDQVILFANSYNRGVSQPLPQCGPFKIEPQPNGLMAVQENNPDPKVFFFQNFNLSPPQYIPSMAYYVGQAPYKGPAPQQRVKQIQRSPKPAAFSPPSPQQTMNPALAPNVPMPTYNISGAVTQAVASPSAAAPAVPHLNLVGH